MELREIEELTLEEVSKRFNLSENYIYSKFKQAQKSIIKNYNMALTKEGGYGKPTKYFVENLADNRAMTIYEEKSPIVIGVSNIAMPEWEFLVFMAATAIPGFVFRGTSEQLLQYAQLPVTKTTLSQIDDAIKSLEEQDIIKYVKLNADKYYAIILQREAEKEISLGLNIIETSKLLADKYGKKKWSAIAKTWIALGYIQQTRKGGNFTNDDLEKLTGLSRYLILESKKILSDADIFEIKKVIDNGLCKGQKATMNGLYEANRSISTDQEVVKKGSLNKDFLLLLNKN